MLKYIKILSSDQHYAIVMLIFSTIYLILGLDIEDGFFSDPIGSGLWVRAVAICIMGLSLLLLIFPTSFVGRFPVLKEWINRLPFIFITILYAQFLPLVGFFIATIILLFILSLLFNARVLKAIISAIVMTIIIYIIFDIFLSINLPAGLYFR